MAVASNSGSEAIDVAIRIARKWGYQVKGIAPGEALILTASANYHGRSMMPLSSSENPKYREGTLTHHYAASVKADLL
jgi:ornithine--oxo-acid transaminase